jgi:hypothetical protein
MWPMGLLFSSIHTHTQKKIHSLNQKIWQTHIPGHMYKKPKRLKHPLLIGHTRHDRAILRDQANGTIRSHNQACQERPNNCYKTHQTFDLMKGCIGKLARYNDS